MEQNNQTKYMSDALHGFDYRHNNKVTMSASIGTIELTYKVKTEVDKETRAVYGELLGDMFADLLPDNPAEAEPAWFQAVLIQNNRVVDVEVAVAASEAIAQAFRWNATRQFEREYYPQAGDIDY